MFHKHLKLQISTTILCLFSPNVSISSPTIVNFHQKHLYAPIILARKSRRSDPMPASFSPIHSVTKSPPHNSANVSEFFFSCLCPYCHSLLLEPNLLYRLVSLVLVFSLNLVFSICHQCYVYKSNLIWCPCLKRFIGCHVTGHRQGCSESPYPANPPPFIAVTALFCFFFFSFFPLLHECSCNSSLCLPLLILFAWTASSYSTLLEKS